MKFNIGDDVYNKERGVGKIKKIDPEDKEFKFLIRFKDGGMAWLPSRSFHKARKAPAKAAE